MQMLLGTDGREGSLSHMLLSGVSTEAIMTDAEDIFWEQLMARGADQCVNPWKLPLLSHLLPLISLSFPVSPMTTLSIFQAAGPCDQRMDG